MNLSRILVFLLLIVNLIFMAWLTFYVINYYHELSSDPLSYNAEKYGLKLCSCSLFSGNSTLYFNSSSVWRVLKRTDDITPFIEYDFNLSKYLYNGTS